MADEPSVLARWDRGLTRRVVDLHRPIVKGYFRSQLLGLEHVPAGAPRWWPTTRATSSPSTCR
jgi:hypothetical protein